MGRHSSDMAARFPRKVSDQHMGCWVEQADPTVGIAPNAGPDVLSPGVGPSPIEGSENRPNVKPTISKGLGTGSPSFPRPDDCLQIKARSPSLQKPKLMRATDSHISSAEERYSHPTTLISSTSSFCLDRFPHLEESLGHGGIDETSQASEGAEMVGFQGTAPIPSAISPYSKRSRSRNSVAMEERIDQQCEAGNKDANREA